jgi:hypothetical protein
MQKETKMTSETTSPQQENQHARKAAYRTAASASAPVYGFGLIGAWVYYIGHATTFLGGVRGILKGIFWPAVLVYEWLKFLNL